MTLSDLPDVNDRIQKSSQGSGMLAPSFFRSRKHAHKTKRTAFGSNIASACLHGRESWAVAAEIQRRLRSFQTQCMKQVLNLSTSEMIDKRVSAADVRKKLGMTGVVRRVECLQLKWRGGARNMPADRLPRELLVSWLPQFPSLQLPPNPVTNSQMTQKGPCCNRRLRTGFPCLVIQPPRVESAHLQISRRTPPSTSICCTCHQRTWPEPCPELPTAELQTSIFATADTTPPAVSVAASSLGWWRRHPTAR